MFTWNAWRYHIPVRILLNKWLWVHRCFIGILSHNSVAAGLIMSCHFLQWHGSWNTPLHCDKAMAVAHVSWLYFNKFTLKEYCSTKHEHIHQWIISCNVWQWMIQKALLSRNLDAYNIAHFHQLAAELWMWRLNSEILLTSCVFFFRLHIHHINIRSNEKREEKVQKGKQHDTKWQMKWLGFSWGC
jgi:hypothetical protein